MTRLIASRQFVLSLDTEVSEEFVGPVSRFPERIASVLQILRCHTICMQFVNMPVFVQRQVPRVHVEQN